MLEKCTPIIFRVRISVFFWKLLKNNKKIPIPTALNPTRRNPSGSRRLKGIAKTTHTTMRLSRVVITTMNILLINFDGFVWRRRTNTKAISVYTLEFWKRRDFATGCRRGERTWNGLGMFVLGLCRSIEKRKLFVRHRSTRVVLFILTSTHVN